MRTAGCQRRVRPPEERRVVRAVPVGAQERALEMQSQRDRPAVTVRRPLLEDGHRILDASGRRGYDRRQEPRDTGRGDRLTDGPDGTRVLGRVVAGRAVDLEVDQARGQQQSVELDGLCRTRGGFLARRDDAPSRQAHAGRRTNADARLDDTDAAQDDGLGHGP